MTKPDLIRFVNAQAQVYSQVIDELTAGRKRTHWIWFIFPQLAGLGHSAMAQRYAIRDLEQARRYLADPILGRRLRDDVWRMIGHKDKSALELLGSPDDLKFRSCLTLFRQAAFEDFGPNVVHRGFGAILRWQAGSSHAGVARLNAAVLKVIKPSGLALRTGTAPSWVG